MHTTKPNAADCDRGSSSPRLIVIAASAGALPAIVEILSPLPTDFAAAIALVQHRAPADPERLVRILAAQTRLRVCHAVDGAVLEAGTVYVCPPRVHMTAEHCVRLLPGPKLDFVQPNADVMFESVARTYADRAIGVVLSGCGSDGALGSVAIAQAGGTVIAQDDHTCGFASMPQIAASTGAVQRMLTPVEIGQVLHRWSDGLRSTELRPTELRPTELWPTELRPTELQPRERDALTSSPEATTVLLADDHRIVLDGLRVLLEGEPDMKVVANAHDGSAAVRAAAELRPDVVVMDIRMPGVDGIEATRQILACAPSTKVVALSSQTDARSADAILRAGATGYVSKHRAYGELVQAIRMVRTGRVYLSREIARLVTTGWVAPPVSARRPRL